MSIPIKVTLKKSYSIAEGGTSGGTVGEVADGSITTEKLADKSVTENKIADKSIGTSKYKENSIGGSHIATKTLLSRNFSDYCVQNNAIEDGSITPEKLDREYLSQVKWMEFAQNGFAPLAEQVDELKLNKINNPIIHPTLNDVGKVLQLKAADTNAFFWSAEFVEGVGGGVADGSVTTDKLADGSVTTDKLADKSVTPSILDRDYATLVNMGIEDIEIPENVETDVYADSNPSEEYIWGMPLVIPWIKEVSSIDDWLLSAKAFYYDSGDVYQIEEYGVLEPYKFGNNSVSLWNWEKLHVMFIVDESDINTTHIIYDDGGVNALAEISFPKAGFYTQNNMPTAENGLGRCIKIEFNPELKIEKKYLPDDLLNLSDKYATKEELEGVYTVLDSLVETVEQKFSGIIGGVTEFDLTEKDFANVTGTRRYAFYQNTALKNVILPETLKEVGVNTFRGCTGLLTVIMKGLTTLQAGAFYDCTALTDFYLPDVTSADEVPTLNATAFTNTTCKFNVSSEEVKEFYLTDSIWNTFEDRFQIKAVSQ